MSYKVWDGLFGLLVVIWGSFFSGWVVLWLLMQIPIPVPAQDGLKETNDMLIAACEAGGGEAEMTKYGWFKYCIQTGVPTATGVSGFR